MFSNSVFESAEITYSQAISRATRDAMGINKDIVIMGIGVSYPSGIFGTTYEAFASFGPERVIDVPAMENALTGIAVGLATSGKRPIIVHARVDFMALSLDQIINVISKWKYMFGGNAGSCPVVIRALIGRGWGQGATHSQSFHSMLAHFPGLRILMPYSVQDAYDMTLQSALSDIPTVIFEHRSLYSQKGIVEFREESSLVECFNPIKVKSGSDITLAGYSFAVHELIGAATLLEQFGIHADVIDMRSLELNSIEVLSKSVEESGNLILHDVSWTSFGATAEILSRLLELGLRRTFSVARLGLAASPAPASEFLEPYFYTSIESIAKTAMDLLGKKVTKPLKSTSGVGADFQGPY
jgi:pyruvate dehydrogenase E1 component beta subunit